MSLCCCVQCTALLTRSAFLTFSRLADLPTVVQLASMSSKQGTVTVAVRHFAIVHVAGEGDVYIPRPVMDTAGGRLTAGQRVVVETVTGPRGPMATKVTRSL